MKFIVEVAFPLEPFNTYVRKGIAGEKLAEVLDGIKPEVVYSTDNGVGRGALMIIDVTTPPGPAHHRAVDAQLRRIRALPRRDGVSGTPIGWPGKYATT